MYFCCPVCQQPLANEAKLWRCSAGHCFDVAKEGYVNLLPVNKKHSKDPGDNKEMMAARRLFLDSGHYQPLIDRIITIIDELNIQPNFTVDVGCGEGYYTSRLLDKVGNPLVGVDISRAALRYAAKRYRDIQFTVASAFDLPLQDGCADLVLRIFAPGSESELARICAENGIVINVSAGPKHHFAVKQLIYDAPRLHPEREAQLAGFQLLHEERLQWQMNLPQGEICAAFLQMTPYAWKFSEQQKNALQAQGLMCEIDFKIDVFKRDK